GESGGGQGGALSLRSLRQGQLRACRNPRALPEAPVTRMPRPHGGWPVLLLGVSADDDPDLI
ncbi:MAG TPA: hypothetical protein VK599_00355, partial [Streptosporangiaceae bacterium]|nr:hypothetical protein [Streptosporangiaceae bacterium]